MAAEEHVEATLRACLRAADASSPVFVRSTWPFLRAGDRLACKTCFGSAYTGVQSKLLGRGPGRAADAIAALANSAASVAYLAVSFPFVTNVFSDAGWRSTNGGTPRIRSRLGLHWCAASPAPELTLQPELETLNGTLAGPGAGPGLVNRCRRQRLFVSALSVGVASWSNAEATRPLSMLLDLVAPALGPWAATMRIASAAAPASRLEVPPPAV